jgi:hypothetical protein
VIIQAKCTPWSKVQARASQPPVIYQGTRRGIPMPPVWTSPDGRSIRRERLPYTSGRSFCSDSMRAIITQRSIKTVWQLAQRVFS